MTRTSIYQADEPGEAPEGDSIRIFLRDFRIELRVGVNPEEQDTSQPVIINAEVEAAVPHRYKDLKETSLERVINYASLHAFIQDELPKLGHIPLLETVAEQIIAFCFLDKRVEKVRVRLEKPQILPGAAGAGIEIFRLRHNTKV
jgi:7,8-dihydroneopterin aldolase/epimerase/oxygenase